MVTLYDFMYIKYYITLKFTNSSYERISCIYFYEEFRYASNIAI